MTVATPQTPHKPRIIGVDVARGLALLGMMAVHTFETFTPNGAPSAANVIAGGRAAATFVFLAGVSLAFLSGGRRVVTGHRRTAAAAGIAVRAVLVGLLGLALAYLPGDVDVILANYGLMFLIAVPLLGRSPRLLAAIAAGLIVVGPVLLVATTDSSLEIKDSLDPQLGALLQSPQSLLALLLIAGAYPVVAYMAYMCAGLAVGRLDLSCRRVAGWLLGGGFALAIVARAGAWLLLNPGGGMARLIEASGLSGSTAEIRRQLLWEEPERIDSWWFLALPTQHANTPFDLAHTLGSAMAVLGAVLLLARLPIVTRMLEPIAILGSMSLTVYTWHLLLLASGILQGSGPALYLLMVSTALAFTIIWRRHFSQGPLEKVVAKAADRTRRAVAVRLAPTAA